MTEAFYYNDHKLPAYQPPDHGYEAVLVHRGMAWVSGNVPKSGMINLHPGKAGADVTLEQAEGAARLALCNALSSLSHAIGGLDAVDQVLKITVFVASGPGFNLQSQVANAASNLLRDILGERGRHVRSAVGVAQLPRNSSVEIDMVVAVSEKL